MKKISSRRQVKILQERLQQISAEHNELLTSRNTYRQKVNELSEKLEMKERMMAALTQRCNDLSQMVGVEQGRAGAFRGVLYLAHGRDPNGSTSRQETVVTKFGGVSADKCEAQTANTEFHGRAV